MTRECHLRIDCPRCGSSITAESAFSRWMRETKVLESKKGLVLSDMDYIFHGFKPNTHGREVQTQMVVEVKTNGADPSPSQHDTLHIFNQILRNRMPSIHCKHKRQAGNAPLKVRSTLWKRDVDVVNYGVHVLRLSCTDPNNSDVITWDRKPITREQLIDLLLFKIDPDTFGPLDTRRHHLDPCKNQISLFS